MEEVRIGSQMLDQLHLQDANDVSILQQQPPQHQKNQQRQRQRVKKTSKNEANLEAELTSLKNEIEYMPMKTPISILQELLSRRGKSSFLIDFLLT
jgi:hypothetical protein